MQWNAILGDIDVCIQKLIDLETHLNSFTHISRLPNELLAEILVIYGPRLLFLHRPGQQVHIDRSLVA